MTQPDPPSAPACCAECEDPEACAAHAACARAEWRRVEASTQPPPAPASPAQERCGRPSPLGVYPPWFCSLVKDHEGRCCWRSRDVEIIEQWIPPQAEPPAVDARPFAEGTALLDKIKALPPRTEWLGGQRVAYVKREDVIYLVEQAALPQPSPEREPHMCATCLTPNACAAEGCSAPRVHADLVLEMRGDEYRTVAGALEALQQRVQALERQLQEARRTNTRLHRRSQMAEAAANLKVEEWGLRRSRAGRDYVFALGRWHAFEEAARMVRDFAGPPLVEPARRLHTLADQLDALAHPPSPVTPTPEDA